MIAAGISYRRVSRVAPCAVCGRADWCRASADGAIAVCNRVASDRPARGEGGGWIHRLGGQWHRATTLRASSDAGPAKLSPAELVLIDRQCRANLTPARLGTLADRLRVSARSLTAMDVGWHVDVSAFTFPMRDGDGQIVGIRTRPLDGKKKCIAGSRLGVIVPGDFEPIDDAWLLVCEGESDAAAALDLGYRAVGRPGCESCAATVVTHVSRTRPARVAILADADPPGQLGGHKLARRIADAGIGVRVLTLPDGAKDLRQWKSDGATHHDLAAMLDAPATRST